MGDGGKTWVALLLFALGSAGCRREASPATATATGSLTLGAAASLRPVLPALIAAFDGGSVTATYASSGDLRRQVEAGAPIDLALFANEAPLDALIDGGYADGTTRRGFATNRLVLVGKKGGARVTLEKIDALGPNDRVALGDPAAVPAGAYALGALRAAGKFDGLKGQLVYGGDVGQVLGYARRGEVAAAFVYATDARSMGDVEVFEELPEALTGKIALVGAVTTLGKRSASAARFLAFLESPEARAIFEEKGFRPP